MNTTALVDDIAYMQVPWMKLVSVGWINKSGECEEMADDIPSSSRRI
jgi:hypothetical protein